eukprot:6884794-Prymnesium_polylepis.1
MAHRPVVECSRGGKADGPGCVHYLRHSEPPPCSPGAHAQVIWRQHIDFPKLLCDPSAQSNPSNHACSKTRAQSAASVP